MGGALDRLPRDPLPALLAAGDAALAYQVERDLLRRPVPPLEMLWRLPGAAAILRRQRPDGSWAYGGTQTSPGTNYALLETFRRLRELVEQYNLSVAHPALALAAEYVLSCQSAAGDIRGIIGNQWMPYYHGVLLELLVKAGLGEDGRVLRGLDWLLAVRQDDGGWMVPAQGVPAAAKTAEMWTGPPLPHDRSLPSSHLATGMALRGLAAHPRYRDRPEVRAAAEWLKGRFFRADSYYDRQAPAYWLKFQFPFWWPNLLTALDTLALLNYGADDPAVAAGLDWFVESQAADGLWPTGYGSGSKAALARAWVGLAIGRVLMAYG